MPYNQNEQSCHDGMCGGCLSCLTAQGLITTNTAVISRELDLIGRYSYADMMIAIWEDTCIS
jgi:hypothetical protein